MLESWFLKSHVLRWEEWTEGSMTCMVEGDFKDACHNLITCYFNSALLFVSADVADFEKCCGIMMNCCF